MSINNTTTEEQLVAARRGKWSERGVPHKGWVCIDIEDLGEPQIECEMCESQTIRYVHHMEHPDYSRQLSVGCICAGHMEGSLTAARDREAQMRARASKRKRWVSRRWKVSVRGNLTLTADGYRITVYQRGTGWGCTIVEIRTDAVQHSRRNYATADRAKLAGFDQITRELAKS
ncbi:hypothetical protein [Burkholderia ubonensis]|uniref:hypothetical protein n=1 Tax=Burkholderia ubonensis TaxID=101571 RepID=UPI0009B42045|nr:hypothetical protein [Burkholderia ubonensis]